MSHSWNDSNAEGLALAEKGQWAAATRAFEEALATVDAEVAHDAVTQTANDDVRARLLLNIGQSFFHQGLLEESRRFAERSCALRVSLYGEQSLIVARTRGDLAVILAASGHTDEAMSLLERAVSAVERKRGDESAHLVPLLTSAARLLSRSKPDLAAPYVARLKALLFAQQQAQNAQVYPRTSVPRHSYSENTFATAGDDHLLRSAIAQTVDLLRATPSVNMAVPEGAPRRTFAESTATAPVTFASDSGPSVALPEDIQLEDLLPLEVPTENIATTNAVDEADTFEDIDDSLFDLVEPPPATLNAIPTAASATVNPLGFEVQYGIPTQLHEPLGDESPALMAEANSAPADSGVRTNRNGVRAVGGVRRGSTQVVALKRLWIVGACVATFGAGFGAFFLYNYLKELVR